MEGRVLEAICYVIKSKVDDWNQDMTEVQLNTTLYWAPTPIYLPASYSVLIVCMHMSKIYFQTDIMKVKMIGPEVQTIMLNYKK